MNYEAMVLNFVLSWKEKLNFPSLLYNIKRAIIICRILQFFAKFFSNFPLFLWKTASKKGILCFDFQTPIDVLWENLSLCENFLWYYKQTIDENLQKLTWKNSLWISKLKSVTIFFAPFSSFVIAFHAYPTGTFEKI